MRSLELHAPVKQIQRSKGRSSVAAAAYRSGSMLRDERTGLVHDYTKKQGVEHSRIYIPDNAPDWARDRSKLWNAAEAKENRSNSCTARELELGFPAEFHEMQRREAGDKICRELVRRYGCAVDISYHAPSRSGDERNHHAHILFTTRGFDDSTKDGWEKKKYRDLNNEPMTVDGEKTTQGKQEILALRKFTADALNRIAERDNLQVKTEHLSFKSRGIDREPTQHRGPSATDMERKGKVSRIEEENRARTVRNSARAMMHAQAAQQAVKLMTDQKSIPAQLMAKKQAELDSARHHAEIDLGRKHQRQKLALENELKEIYSSKPTIQAEISAVETRLQATGVRKVVRDVFRVTAADKSNLNDLNKTLDNIKMRENEMRESLKVDQEREKKALAQREQRKMDALKERSENRTQTTQGRGDSRGQKVSGRSDPEKEKKRDKPEPVPPPPRHALQITQDWAEKTGQNAREVSRQVKNRKIDTSKLKIPENKQQQSAPANESVKEKSKTPDKAPTPKVDKSSSWEQRTGRKESAPAQDQDNKPVRSLTPKRTRDPKPSR